jgi:hypothetical protein
LEFTKVAIFIAASWLGSKYVRLSNSPRFKRTHMISELFQAHGL